jgi:peroxiredoxin
MSTQVKIPSYQKGLKDLKSNLVKVLPAEILKIFNNDANQLKETHQNILKLKVGSKTPNFSLSNALGQTVTLNNLLEKAKVVLIFYRGTWCPYCNLQLNLYQQILEDIKDLGAQLVAVSPQTPDESLNIKEKNELRFEVLSDNGNIVARQFTTVFRNAEEPLNAMTNLGIDFETHYSDDSKELPVPAVFIIEQDRTISFAKAIGGDYRNRVEPLDIIESLKH